VSTPEPDVVVVGAGLSGLACALHLSEAGVPARLLEASDGVGGRVRTDLVAGFRLDRGFQVLLTAYPETRRILDYAALDLSGRWSSPGVSSSAVTTETPPPCTGPFFPAAARRRR